MRIPSMAGRPSIATVSPTPIYNTEGMQIMRALPANLKQKITSAGPLILYLNSQRTVHYWQEEQTTV